VEITDALLAVEQFTGSIWEPACGDGAMSRVFEAAGYTVMSTDLVYRGFGTGGVDFLDTQTQADNVITNPPFKLTEAFIVKAVGAAKRKAAILGRLQLLEGQARRKIWDATPFARVWIFSRRIAFTRPGETDYGTKGGKGGMIPYAWYVWDKSYAGPPQLGWI
jgi:hypothetical protein